MAMDDRKYPAPYLVPPQAYQPGAPAAAETWQSILSAAYHSIRNENLILYQLYLPVENANRLTDYPGTIGYPKLLDASYTGGTWVKLASGAKYIPSVATHINAVAVAELYSVPFSADSYQTMFFRFNGDSGTSSSFTTGGNNKQQFVFGASRFNNLESINLQVVQMRAACSSVVTTGGTAWVDIDGYSRGLMIPHAMLCWWDIDDSV